MLKVIDSAVPVACWSCSVAHNDATLFCPHCSKIQPPPGGNYFTVFGLEPRLNIDLAGLDMGDADWNKAVLKPEFLDAAHARYAHFASTSVERKDDRHGVLHGELTLRGITRPVSLAFTFNRLGKTIFGLHTVAGFSANTTLDRSDFGMTYLLKGVGDEVHLRISLEGKRPK